MKPWTLPLLWAAVLLAGCATSENPKTYVYDGSEWSAGAMIEGSAGAGKPITMPNSLEQMPVEKAKQPQPVPPQLNNEGKLYSPEYFL